MRTSEPRHWCEEPRVHSQDSFPLFTTFPIFNYLALLSCARNQPMTIFECMAKTDRTQTQKTRTMVAWRRCLHLLHETQKATESPATKIAQRRTLYLHSKFIYNPHSTMATFANQASNISALRSKYNQLLSVSNSLEDGGSDEKKGEYCH